MFVGKKHADPSPNLKNSAAEKFMDLWLTRMNQQKQFRERLINKHERIICRNREAQTWKVLRILIIYNACVRCLSACLWIYRHVDLVQNTSPRATTTIEYSVTIRLNSSPQVVWRSHHDDPFAHFHPHDNFRSIRLNFLCRDTWRREEKHKNIVTGKQCKLIREVNKTLCEE